MHLAPNVGSDRSWVYTAPFDLAEGQPQTELLAVRFANVENAMLFKDKFEEAKKINSGEEPAPKSEDSKNVEPTEPTEPAKSTETENIAGGSSAVAGEDSGEQ